MRDRLLRMNEFYEDMVLWRRQLHKHPELSFNEYQTSAFIQSKLESWGIEIIGIAAKTAVIGRIRGKDTGPTVAIRADIDALPIQDEKRCEYKSTVPGIMHACGHDAHTAVLLGLGKWFSEHRNEWSGEILVVFQHAEELCPGGALSVLETGVLDKAEVIYGVHLWTPFPVGHVYSSSGPLMAAADEFEIEIKGKGGHGGLPHNAVDSILVGSHLIVNLQSITSRSVNPAEPCVVTVGMIQAGTTFNVIAEKCILKGTVRTFNKQVRDEVRQRIELIAKETATMFGANAAVKYRVGYPPLINHDQEAQRFFNTAKEMFGIDHVHSSPPIMAAEDYAYYLEHMPGCFMFVGAGNVEEGIVYPHHHPMFDIDERSMLVAAKLLGSMALNFMENK